MVLGKDAQLNSAVVNAVAKVMDIQVVRMKNNSNDEFYGTADKKGIFTEAFRERSDNPRWIVIEGDQNPETIECLNTVLDDNKVLVHLNKERIPLCPNTRIVFEQCSSEGNSPAFVSRCGVVLVEN